MQQALRRVLRSQPEFLAGSPRLYREILLAATQAHPPIPGSQDSPIGRELVPSLEFPRRKEGRRFPPPLSGRENNSLDSTEIISRLGPQLRTGGSTEQSRTGNALEEIEFSLPGALQVDKGQHIVPVLDQQTQRELTQLIHEYEHSNSLGGDVGPTKSLLLTGEPGTGKTITARWLASMLGKPLVTLDLAFVMSHELGRSAHNLREALDWASAHDVVVFIDEFDGIASSRATGNDVGEMRRLVNVLLLRLDSWPQGHLLVAATNHPDLLDRAVERRFDLLIDLPLPTVELRRAMLGGLLPELDTIEIEALAELTPSRSGSSLQRGVERSKRRAAFEGRALTLVDVICSLDLANEPASKERRNRVIRALSRANWSARQIADAVGVTHPTVLSVLKRPD